MSKFLNKNKKAVIGGTVGLASSAIIGYTGYHWLKNNCCNKISDRSTDLEILKTRLNKLGLDDTDSETSIYKNIFNNYLKSKEIIENPSLYSLSELREAGNKMERFGNLIRSYSQLSDEDLKYLYFYYIKDPGYIRLPMLVDDGKKSIVDTVENVKKRVLDAKSKITIPNDIERSDSISTLTYPTELEGLNQRSGSISKLNNSTELEGLSQRSGSYSLNRLSESSDSSKRFSDITNPAEFYEQDVEKILDNIK